MASLRGFGGCLTIGLVFLLLPVLIDGTLVEIGARRARSLCEHPGPLAIYDTTVWNAYSREVRASLPPRWEYMQRTPIPGIQARHGIMLSYIPAKSRNPLFATVTYNRSELRQKGRLIANLTYYRADAGGPIISSLLPIDPHGDAFNCAKIREYGLPEFALL
jgi:hypothetical protein